MGDWRDGEEKRRRGGVVSELIRKDREDQRIERWERILNSKYSRQYREVKGEGVPEYLKKGWDESKWRRIIRFRLGNEIREGVYWEKEENKE